MIAGKTKSRRMLLAVLVILAAPAGAQDSDPIERGKALAFDRNQGNCLSCHLVMGAELPGNIAPPLIQMKARFPDRAKLRAQIWDATKSNPQTVMPPYGRHGILTEAEIELVTDFVLTL